MQVINVIFRIDVDNGLKAGTGHLKEYYNKKFIF